MKLGSVKRTNGLRQEHSHDWCMTGGILDLLSLFCAQKRLTDISGYTKKMHTEARGLQLQLQLQEDCELLVDKPELGM